VEDLVEDAETLSVAEDEAIDFEVEDREEVLLVGTELDCPC